MDVLIMPGTLHGQVDIPASKSAAHRAVLCAALAGGTSTLQPVQPIKDILVTLDAVRALGANAALDQGNITVKGISSPPSSATIDCEESGSTLRFLVPIAAALGTSVRFVGTGRLPHRPMTPLTDELSRHGVTIARQEGEILSISGKLQPGTFRLAGNISSQYITGLLLALPLLEGDSEIILTSPLESKGYVDMTLDTLAQFGVEIQVVENGYHIGGKQSYQSRDCAVEGDYSGAAFWLCAGAIHSQVSVAGLHSYSLQGDREIVHILEQMGAQVQVNPQMVQVSHQPLTAVNVDVSQIPDLLPILAVTAAFAHGTTVLSGAERLRIKESDRLQSVTAGLRAVGALVEEGSDRLVITGQQSLPGGGEVDSFGDHRIAMAMSIAALGCQKPVTIRGAHCVDKSYPDFYKDFAALGGVCHVL